MSSFAILYTGELCQNHRQIPDRMFPFRFRKFNRIFTGAVSGKKNEKI